MSFELIAFVHNKLNTEMPEVNAEINNIYTVLLTHEERINLQHWVTTIVTRDYNGIKYPNLDEATKIVCVVRDFLTLMQGIQVTKKDLKYLETALYNLGIKQIVREDFIRRLGENLTLRTHLLGEGSRLDDFVTEREEIIFDIQQAVEPVKKFFPAEQVDADGFVLELLYNLKQLTLAKEQSDKAEKLFLTGYIDEARPLLEETTNEKNIQQRRYMLAVIYHEGMAVEKNLDRVRDLLTKNISEGDVCSIFFGARIGEDLKEKAGENFETLKNLADAGDVFAQYELAQYEDSKKPEYMTLAADQKYFLAAFELGKMYCFGLNPNYEQARKYFEIAAQSEQHINSMIYLSDIYRNGWGGAVDKEKVLHLCKKIYEREPSEDSINTIALFYKYDQNNPIEAVDWWIIGAEKIFPTCLYNLGWVYFNGRGVEKNWAEAVEYFNKAIAAGANSGFSELHLGKIYCLGLYGSTRDYEQSVTYYDQAVA